MTDDSVLDGIFDSLKSEAERFISCYSGNDDDDVSSYNELRDRCERKAKEKIINSRRKAATSWMMILNACFTMLIFLHNGMESLERILPLHSSFTTGGSIVIPLGTGVKDCYLWQEQLVVVESGRGWAIR
ncbi:hypothetical protein EZJ13_03380 [Enterobacter hormaechei]|nr:hypothetical protein [Enterobacter hormaechei]URL72911.1 hypothetical protein EZJ13_03380 [Enterobacter hormaechei]